MKKLFIFVLFVILFISCTKEQVQQTKAIKGKLVDLTYNYDTKTVYWPTAEGFKHDTVFYGINDKGYFYSSYNYGASEHGGTHIDAPIHFAEGGHSIESIPIECFFGTGVVIDVSKKAENNRDYLVTVEDFKEWESKNGKIPENAIILLYSGWGKYYNDLGKYAGTNEKGPDAVPKLHFPGLSPQAADWLAQNTKVKVVGIDTPSIDYGQSTLFETHRSLCKNNIYAVENVANLEQLPNSNFEVFVFPMKIKGGSGAPVRMLARI